MPKKTVKKSRKKAVSKKTKKEATKSKSYSVAPVAVAGRDEVLKKDGPPVTEKAPVGRTDQLVLRKGPEVPRKE